MREYIKIITGHEAFICDEIQLNASSSAFKIGIGYIKIGKIPDTNNWPEGVIINIYSFKRDGRKLDKI